MTNLFIQVKVTESKHLTQKHYVSSSLRVFVQNLFLLSMFFYVHMRMFLVFIWQTFLTAYKVEDKVTERNLVKMLLKTYFSRNQGYI